MLYMVIERFRNQDAAAVYQRFREKGRMLPDGLKWGAPSSVAFNSAGHFFVFNRGASPLVEFDQTGKFVRVLGEGRYTRPHGLRIDRQDNIWTTDIGSNQVVKFDANGAVRLTDPALFDYPVLYMSEPGYWQMSDAEAKGLGDYLKKGGFIIFDDFRDEHWYNLEAQMRRVMPEGKWLSLDAKHQVYHSFFEIDALDLLTSYGPHKPEYFGMFEDNDPTKRLLAVANFNNDLGEYWEFSDQGVDPVDLSNEAYKFGVNYFIYALIH